MPLYDHACAQGHITEEYRPMAGPHPATITCGTCGGPASRIFTASAVVDDFPEHYNDSFGCVVKNRQHHRALQKERGTHDWEPRRETPSTERLRKEGAI